MTTRIGAWDCSYCGHTKNRGPNKYCAGCGRGRPEGVHFYLPEDAEVVTDADELRRANIGPDWYCEHCNSATKADEGFCGNCGAEKGQSHKHATTTYQPGEEPRTAEEAEAHHASKKPKKPSYQEEPRTDRQIRPFQNIRLPEFDPTPFLVGGAAILAVALIATFLYFFFRTRDVPVTVTGVSWTRTIEVEEFRTLSESGWEVPSDGRVVSSERKVHHYESVLDHYETKTRTETYQEQVGSHTETYKCGTIDKGNGYFEDQMCERTVSDYETRTRTIEYQEPVYRDEPVYQTWYVYEVDRWVYDHSENASGQSHEVSWPNASLSSDEREGNRSQSYTVYFADEEGKGYSLSMDYDRWMSFEVGQKYSGKINTFGILLEVETK